MNPTSRFVFLLLLVFVSFNAFPQKKYGGALDSASKYHSVNSELAIYWARKANNEATNKQQEANSLLLLGILYNDISKYDSAIIFFDRAMALFTVINDSVGIADTYHNKGVTYEYQSSYDEALQLYEKGYLIRRHLGIKTEEASSLNNMGNIHVYLNSYSKALELFHSALKLGEEAGHKKTVINAYNNIGMVYDYTNDLDKALEYYKLAEKGFTELNERGHLGGTLNNIGLIYKNKREPKKAIPYYEKALAIYTDLKSEFGVAVLLNNLGVVYSLLDDQQKALQYHLKALATNTAIGNSDGIGNSNNSIGECYLKLGKFALASQYFLKGLSLAVKIESNDRIAESYEGLARAYEGLGDFKNALAYTKLSKTVRDSIFSIEKAQKLLELEQKYESSLKQKQIELLNSQAEKQKLEIASQQAVISQRNIQLAFIASSILLLALVAWLFYSRMKLQQKRRLEALNNEKEHAVIRSIYEQRMSIARDMHDEIGSGLTHIAMLSELLAVQKKPEAEIRKEVETISDISRTLLQCMSEIIWAINPRNETLDSLVAYIREQTNKYFEPFDIRYHISVPDQIPAVKLTNLQRRNLFLVTKETLNNALKYAGASDISLSMALEENWVNLKVQDNGKGFNFDKIRKTANGLKNMQSRMEEVRGKFEIESSSAGTTVSYGVPVTT